MRKAILTSLLLALWGPLEALAQTARTENSPGWDMMPWGMGGMMFMMPVMFLLAIALLIAVIYMVRRVGDFDRRDTGLTRTDTALDILKKRYARGEIDREEFERMKRELED